MFAARGIPILDADMIAREVVEVGTDGLAEVVATFGPEVLESSGALDRKKLGALVFGDPTARKRLEQITHPRIAAITMNRIAAFALLPTSERPPYVIYDAALLVENGSYKKFPEIIVVTTSRANQLARLMKRDATTQTDANARIDAQLPIEDKVRVATFVIQNDGSEEDLETQVARVDGELRAKGNESI